jgi:hypothetical protein
MGTAFSPEVLASPGDGTLHRGKQPQHHTDYGEDNADHPPDGNLEQE